MSTPRKTPHPNSNIRSPETQSTSSKDFPRDASALYSGEENRLSALKLRPPPSTSIPPSQEGTSISVPTVRKTRLPTYPPTGNIGSPKTHSTSLSEDFRRRRRDAFAFYSNDENRLSAMKLRPLPGTSAPDPPSQDFTSISTVPTVRKTRLSMETDLFGVISDLLEEFEMDDDKSILPQ